MEQISYVIKTNIHREILAKALKGDRVLPKYAYFRIGTGGLADDGNPIRHNGSVTSLTKGIKEKNSTLEKKYNFSNVEGSKLYEYIYKLKLDTTAQIPNERKKDTDLIGKSITELGLYDAEDNLCYLETFKGYGPLQPEHIYEFEMRILVN